MRKPSRSGCTKISCFGTSVPVTSIRSVKHVRFAFVTVTDCPMATLTFGSPAETGRADARKAVPASKHTNVARAALEDDKLSAKRKASSCLPPQSGRFQQSLKILLSDLSGIFTYRKNFVGGRPKIDYLALVFACRFRLGIGCH